MEREVGRVDMEEERGRGPNREVMESDVGGGGEGEETGRRGGGN